MAECFRFLSVLIALIIFFVAYGTNFSVPLFFIDDNGLLNIPQLLLPLSPRLFKTLLTPGYHLDFYPLREWSYWLDIHFFPLFFNLGESKGSLFLFRFHNACIFIGASIGLFSFLRLLRLTKTLSLSIVLLWFLNPFHYEMIWWISARKDLLALNYFVWSAVAWLTFENTKKQAWGILSLFLFVFSLFSKTSFILCPFALLFFYLSKRRFQFPFFLVSFACLVSVFWGLLQSWQYTEVVDMRFFYPWSYRLQACLEALGRMVLGIFYSGVNAIDTYNFGEWVSLNHKFLWWGISFFTLITGISIVAFKKNRFLLLAAFFWTTYLPISGLLFTHRHFYSVRYFEPSLLVLTVGLSILIARYQYLIRYPLRFFLFGCLFLFFSGQLLLEKVNWSSNLQIIKKAMEVTPGNIALNTYYLRNLRELARQESGSEELKALITTVETSLAHQCLPKIENESLGTTSLCQIFFSLGHWPQKQNAIPLSNKEKTLAVLDWEAKTKSRQLNISIESAKEEQWAFRLLLLDEFQPPPKKRPFLTTEGERKDYLAALHKWDPKSDAYLTLQKKWEEMGVLSSGFDVTQHQRSLQ